MSTLTRSDDLCKCGHIRAHHIYEEAGCRPGFECLAGCEQFAPVANSQDGLLEALRQAERENTQVRPCQACEVLASVTEPVKSALETALAGTIGRDKLVTILRSHGYAVGRRAIERHRQEGHTS